MMVDAKKIGEYFAEIGLVRPGPITHAYQCNTCDDTKEIGVEIKGIYQRVPCPDCTCPTCGDKGVVTHNVPVGHPDFGKLFPCPNPTCTVVREQQQARERKLIETAQLDPEYTGYTLDTFMALPEHLRQGKLQAYWAAYYFIAGCERGCWVNRADIAARFDEEVEDNSRNWIVFYGLHGYGKTGMASSILNGVTARGQSARYVRLQKYIQSLQNRYDAQRIGQINDEYGDLSSGAVQDLVRESPILIADEFDVPDIRENKLAIVEDLIRHRYANKLPTVLTTNLDPQAFELRWGPTIASVVKARAHWIPVGGERLRETVEAFNWE